MKIHQSCDLFLQIVNAIYIEILIMFMNRKRISGLCLTAAALMLGACSSTSQDVVNGEINDPFESTNRAVFAFNEGFDEVITDPVISGYRTVVPKEGRTAILSFMRNLSAPINLGNELLQGDLKGAGNVVFRTVVNTLTGFGGLIDVAANEGYAYESEDFGQTLGVWGFGHGAYFVIPVIGPSSARDSIGFIADSYADPLANYLDNVDHEEWQYARMGVDLLAVRDSLQDVLKELQLSSIDYYATLRSGYYQRRSAEVNDNDHDNQNIPDIPDFDDF